MDHVCKKSLMAEWLEQASQWHEVYCHDLEVMSSNPCQVQLGVHSTSVPNRTLIKYIKSWNEFSFSLTHLGYQRGFTRNVNTGVHSDVYRHVFVYNWSNVSPSPIVNIDERCENWEYEYGFLFVISVLTTALHYIFFSKYWTCTTQ